MRIKSNDIVLLDVTDTKKVDVHISSNHPTIQIYNQNDSQESFTPDWSNVPLVLTATIYADSTDITKEISSFKWSRKIGDTVEVLSSKTNILTISSNELNSTVSMIQYICSVTYNNKTSENLITFARTDVGKDGANGSSAPSVKAQYSTDGISGWTATLNTSIHKYIRFSYDNGTTWTSAIKIAGEDGTSVNIKGTATSKSAVSGTSYYTLVYNSTTITGATIGDAYLLDGNLYVCVDSRDGNDYFMDVGHIQGPQGDKGDSYYLFIRYADNISGSGISASPEGKSYIGFYRSSVNQVPTDVSSATWNWAKFVGEDAKSITLSANAQVFKIDKSNTMTPATITVTAQAINTTIPSSGWTYSTDGGKTFSTTAPIGVTRSGNVVTLTGSSITSSSIVIKASDGTYSDLLTVYKVSDGADGKPGDEGKPASTVFLTNENITFAANANGQITGTTVYCNVVAYSGTTKVTPTIGTILSTEIPTGMTIGTATTISNEIVIPITIANNATLGSAQNVNGTINIPITSPVATSLKLTWSKVNSGVKGDNGVGIKSVTVTYGTSTSASTQPTSWQSSIPVVTEGAYLWTRTITDYTDDAIADTVTYTYAKQGKTGDTGSPGSPVTVSKIEYQSGTSATTAPTSTWSTSVVSVAEGNYLWTKTTFSDGKVAYGVARQGVKGDKGDTGTPASLVDITPSALYFKSTTGKDGTFTPDYIYLYPRFQTVTYSKWEYSTNGGTTWVAASGANGLTIDTYNSVANTLRIAKTSALYTDTVTSISFRCVSSNVSVYDTVSIAKIYDVVDLQIGGRNYIQNSAQEFTKEAGVAQAEYLSLPYDLTPLIEEHGVDQTYTLSFDLKSKDITNNNRISIYPEPGTTPPHKYVFPSTSFVVTQEYQRFSITFKPTRSSNNNATLTRISVYGTYNTGNIPVIKNLKLELGNKATDWSPAPEDLKSITFQLYAPKGYLITNDVPEVTLQTFAYDGGQVITGATFAWYSWNGEVWSVIGGATGVSLALNKNTILKSSVYKCIMTYKGKTYEATATVEDKTDIYDSLINVVAKYSPTNRLYWVLYSTVYSEEGERDELLGPVSATAPTNPTTGAYWYKIDETNYNVTLMKYSGTAWVTTTDSQELVYDWFLFNDIDDIITLGSQSKVKIVTSNDFSRVCSVQCNVSDSELMPLTHNNQILNDPNDPVVSSVTPANPVNGQLWIKTGANGIYTLLVWDASLGQWIVSEADSQVKVHINKPTSYKVGDVWVVGSDYEPTVYVNGVAQTTKYLTGTMLKAQYSSQTYKDSDWVEALNYKKEIDKLQESLNVYNQYFTFDETGMTMRAKNLSGQISEFSTKLTNNELGFYQGDNKVAYINNNQLNISKAEITNGMTIGGASPILEIGNFAIIQESNGSLSIGLKS